MLVLDVWMRLVLISVSSSCLPIFPARESLAGGSGSVQR